MYESHIHIQLNPDSSNLSGKSKTVRVIGGFEVSRVKLVRKLPGGESKRFDLLGFNCLYYNYSVYLLYKTI